MASARVLVRRKAVPNAAVNPKHDDGKSQMNCEDSAIALLDDIETATRVKQRFTAGH